jgi:hypothetical protein
MSLNDPALRERLEAAQAKKTFTIGGRGYARIPCGYEGGESGDYVLDSAFAEVGTEKAVCVQCGAPSGFLHLLGCESEQCPKCGEQALGCACKYDPVEDWRPVARDSRAAALPFPQRQFWCVTAMDLEAIAQVLEPFTLAELEFQTEKVYEWFQARDQEGRRWHVSRKHDVHEPSQPDHTAALRIVLMPVPENEERFGQWMADLLGCPVWFGRVTRVGAGEWHHEQQKCFAPKAEPSAAADPGGASVCVLRAGGPARLR